MAVVRDLSYSDTYLTYLSTIALFCGISCTIVMIKFKGFKASLNVSGKGSGREYEIPPQLSVVGAYRTSKEEYFGNINYLEARKTITPSMVKLPPATIQPQVAGSVTTSKSTGDLTTLQNIPAEVIKSTPNVSVLNAQGNNQSKSQLKEQKRVEKERLIEQKKREKLAAQEKEKQEKLRKEREKQAAQQQAKEEKEREKRAKQQQAKEAKEREKQKKKKTIAPQPQQQAVVEQATLPLRSTNARQKEQRGPKKVEAPQPPQFDKVEQRVQPHANPQSHNPVQNSANTLESSISRNSGPPPYSDTPEIVPNRSDSTGNISFGKSNKEDSSWDLISKHREQMTRTTVPNNNNTRQRNMDLQYNVGNVTHDNRDNSEA